MKRVFVFLMTLMIVFGLTVSANAILIDRGGGMIYSTDLDVTWLQDANYAMTSGYDDDGLVTWDAAYNWVSNLSYGGFDDWRLPKFDPLYNRETTTVQSEMAYLRYVELGPPYGSSSSFDPSPFINLGDTDEPWYWSGTLNDPSSVWRFDFWCG